MFKLIIFRAGVREVQLKPRSMMLKFPCLNPPCILFVTIPAVPRLLWKDAAVADWHLVNSTINLKFNRVCVTLLRQFKLPGLNLSATPNIPEHISSTTCVPLPSDGGGDVVLGRRRFSCLRIHNLSICIVPCS